MVIIDPICELEKWISLGKNYASKNNSGFIVVNIISKINQTDEEIEFVRQSFELADNLGAEKVFNLDVSIMSTIMRLAEIENVSHLLFPRSFKYRLLTLFSKNLSLQKDDYLNKDVYLFAFDNKLRKQKLMQNEHRILSL